jgi:hypothetical protein
MSIVTYNNRSIRNISAIPGAAESLTHIKTLTASSSSTLSFVDGSSDVVLDNTYPIYLFKIINTHPATDGQKITFQGSTNTGSSYGVTATTTAFDAEHSEGDANSFSYNTSSDLAQGTGFQPLSLNNIGNDNDQSASGELFLFNPSSTTFVKHFIYTGSSLNNGDYLSNDFVAGYFNTTSAIDAIQFKMESGNIDAGTIKLYGLKDS